MSHDNRLMRRIDYDLSCYHEEADTKILFHITQFNRNYRVQVRCTDSDIPVIILANFRFRKAETEIIINLSTYKKKLSRFILLIVTLKDEYRSGYFEGSSSQVTSGN